MTISRLTVVLKTAMRPLVCLLFAAVVFAAGSGAAVYAGPRLNPVAISKEKSVKREPSTALRLKLGIPKSTPDPYVSYLPVESRPNYKLWRERMQVQDVSRHIAQKSAAQMMSNMVALLPVGETEAPAVRGVNDTQATAQFIAAFGTGSGDDAAADIAGNLKTPDPATGFTPTAEDEGDINQASNSTVGDGQAKTASGTIGDGPFGSPSLTVVPIGPFGEDDGDINKANVTGLDLDELVTADGEIGNGPFGLTSGDFDVYSFSVSAPESIIIEVLQRDGDTDMDPIVALVASDGEILFVNDDNGFSVESYLNISFFCPQQPCTADTYYVFVGGWSGEQVLSDASFPSNRFNSSTGPGADSTGLYELQVTRTIVPSGDFDFYSVVANANDLISIEVDTSDFGGLLDPIVALYDSAGNMLALNDDNPDQTVPTFDSYLAHFAPYSDTFYFVVGGFDQTVFPTSPLSFLADPFDSGSGSGSGLSSTGSYDVIVTRNHIDFDYYAFDLQAGDIIGMNISGATPQIALFAENQQGLVAADFPTGGKFPAASPLPGGGDANAAYVASEAGTYAIRVGYGLGAYDLEVRAFRPPQEATGTTQRLFIDFNGATVDTTKFSGVAAGHTQPSVLSPLAGFLPAWGLTGGDENAVIDAILAAVEQNLSTDIRLNGNNPAFEIEILNSRDHADPFGQADVSRIIVGGTIAQSGITTIGIAQSIDIGNFDQSEDSLVLLDKLSAGAGDPNSLNSIGLGTATKIQLVGEGVGNVVAHEAGHFFANFHTDNGNLIPNLMDTGGDLPGLVGVGDDGSFGTGDDVDVNFVSDEYEPAEGILGLEDTKNAIAFGLTSGVPGVPLLLRRSDTGRWFGYDVEGLAVASSGSVDLEPGLFWSVESISDFDGNDDDDLLLRNGGNGQWMISLMDGSTAGSSSGVALPKSFDWQLAANADFNNDGNADVLLRNQVNGRWRMYLMDGFTVVQEATVGIAADLVWDPVASGDFDGDGAADLLIRRSDNGAWRMYRFSGTTVVETALVSLSKDGDFAIREGGRFQR